MICHANNQRSAMNPTPPCRLALLHAVGRSEGQAKPETSKPLASIEKASSPQAQTVTYPVQTIPGTGQVIKIHPFFIKFECKACPKGMGGGRDVEEPDVRWTLPRAADFESEEYNEVSLGPILRSLKSSEDYHPLHMSNCPIISLSTCQRWHLNAWVACVRLSRAIEFI